MAYGRELLRRAGEGLLQGARNFDDAYTGRVNRMYENANPAVQVAAVMVGGGHPTFRRGQMEREIGPETRMQQMSRTAVEYALPAMSAVPKYVLPATGVTMAGKALMDLTAGLGQQTEGTLEV